jgi:GT2 family glycosyltransferase
MTPHITVVIPTHRRAKLLAAALRSVAAQSFERERFEVIVVASQEDDAPAICAQIAAETGLKVTSVSIPNDPWHGRSPSAKRNYGGELAKSEWLAFLDDDCEADPDWLRGGAEMFPGQVAVEGRKVIPPPPIPTMTYRGLLSFEKPGGFQSCNIFYRREEFLKLGGFDTRFPFYLEDSDLAWTFLDHGYAIPHAERAIVRHPVNPPAPWRFLDDGKRAFLLPLLQNKHPEQSRRAGVRAVGRSGLIYLAAWLLAVALTVAFGWIGLLAGLSVVVMLAIIGAWRLFRGCKVTLHEVAVTTFLLPIVPCVRVIYYARGYFRFRHVVK